MVVLKLYPLLVITSYSIHYTKLYDFSKPVFSSGKKLGIALVGLGNYATHQLAPAFQETSLCYLNGIVTGTPAKIDKWSYNFV